MSERIFNMHSQMQNQLSSSSRVPLGFSGKSSENYLLPIGKLVQNPRDNKSRVFNDLGNIIHKSPKKPEIFQDLKGKVNQESIVNLSEITEEIVDDYDDITPCIHSEFVDDYIDLIPGGLKKKTKELLEARREIVCVTPPPPEFAEDSFEMDSSFIATIPTPFYDVCPAPPTPPALKDDAVFDFDAAIDFDF